MFPFRKAQPVPGYLSSFNPEMPRPTIMGQGRLTPRRGVELGVIPQRALGDSSGTRFLNNIHVWHDVAPDTTLNRRTDPELVLRDQGKYVGFPVFPQSRNDLRQIILGRNAISGRGGVAQLPKLPDGRRYSDNAIAQAIEFLTPTASRLGYTIESKPGSQSISWSRSVPRAFQGEMEPGAEIGYPAFRTGWGKTEMGESEDLLANLAGRPLRNSDRVGLNNILNSYEFAMDNNLGGSMSYSNLGERFLYGNRREGYQVMNPNSAVDLSYAQGPASEYYPPTPNRWIDSADSLYLSRGDTPLYQRTVSPGYRTYVNPVDYAMSNLQGKYPVDRVSINPEYLPQVPQRMVAYQPMMSRELPDLANRYLAPGYSVDGQGRVVQIDGRGRVRQQVRVAPDFVVDQLQNAGLAQRLSSTDVTDQVMGLKPMNPNVRQTVRDYNADIYGYSNVPNPQSQLPPRRQQIRGMYNMNTIEDPEIYGAYESNFNKPGGQLMLPSSVLEDRELSPYPLSLSSTVDDDLGWERNRIPGFVDMVEDRKKTENLKAVERETDAFDVLDRISSRVRELNAASRIADNQAVRDRPVISTETMVNPITGDTYQAQVMRERRGMRPIAELTPEVMTPAQLNALANRGKAREMQKRLDMTNAAIAEAYGKYPSMDTQKVRVSWTDQQGNIQSDTYDWNLQEQLQAGRDFQNLGYARSVHYVPPGQAVSQRYEVPMPEWEKTKYWMNTTNAIPTVQSPVVLTDDPRFQGSAARYRFW